MAGDSHFPNDGRRGHPADLSVEPAPSRGLGSLLKELVEGGADLVRQEARLARVETGELARNLGIGAGAVAAGAVLALLGALAFIAGLILLAGDQWLRDRYWLAALLVTVLAGVAAALAARKGLAMLSPTRLAPEQTVATLKEDKEWLKQLRT
jgi:hypothetical protein